MTCTIHGVEYPQLLYSERHEQPLWVGQCGVCSKEEALQRRAQQMESETHIETMRRAQAAVEASDSDTNSLVQQEIDAYIEQVRGEAMSNWAEWAADVRRRNWESTFSSVQQERIAQFVEQLKTEARHG